MEGLGSVLGSVGSYIGGQEANRANARMADRQMNFQMHMSNSAHQREVIDLRDAGLNPLLSVTGGGASTPPGAMASQENALGNAISTAKDFQNLKLATDRQKEEIELMAAQRRKTNTESAVISKGIPEADMKNKMYKLAEPWINKLLQKIETNTKPLLQKGMP